MSLNKNISYDLYDMIKNFSYEKIISLFNKYATNNILEEYKRENLNIQFLLMIIKKLLIYLNIKEFLI